MSSGDRTRGGVGSGISRGPSLSLSEVLENPGLLKLELMTQGLRVSDELKNTLLNRGPSAFATSYELDLVLPEGTVATVPIHPKLSHNSPYILEKTDSGHQISADTKKVNVSLVAPPGFYDRKTSSGVPLGQFATMHGSYLALSPISECEFLGSSDRCRFCSLQGTRPGSGNRVPVEDVVEAVRLAREERPIHMVYLSVGYIDGPDSGVHALEPYVRAIKNAFSLLVAIDALPPAEDGWIDRTYAMGVDSVSYNLEIFGAKEFKETCPGPARKLGRKRFLSALSYAATVFNPGAVVCHLIVGLEPVANTIDGIDELVKRGVVPVLPVYRPFKGIDLRQSDEGTTEILHTEDLGQVYAHLYNQLRKHKIPMGWVRDISVVTTPMEGRYFVGDETRLGGFIQRMFNDPHRKPSPTWVDIRRNLRVRESSEGTEA